MCKPLSNHFDNIFLKFQCRFRKGFGAQHCLLLMIDRWKKAVDSNKDFGAILTDLSKAFDCICHDLLVAKLHTYGTKIANKNWILIQYMGEYYMFLRDRS